MPSLTNVLSIPDGAPSESLLEAVTSATLKGTEVIVEDGAVTVRGPSFAAATAGMATVSAVLSRHGAVLSDQPRPPRRIRRPSSRPRRVSQPSSGGSSKITRDKVTQWLARQDYAVTCKQVTDGLSGSVRSVRGTLNVLVALRRVVITGRTGGQHPTTLYALAGREVSAPPFPENLDPGWGRPSPARTRILARLVAAPGALTVTELMDTAPASYRSVMRTIDEYGLPGGLITKARCQGTSHTVYEYSLTTAGRIRAEEYARVAAATLSNRPVTVSIDLDPTRSDFDEAVAAFELLAGHYNATFTTWRS